MWMTPTERVTTLPKKWKKEKAEASGICRKGGGDADVTC